MPRITIEVGSKRRIRREMRDTRRREQFKRPAVMRQDAASGAETAVQRLEAELARTDRLLAVEPIGVEARMFRVVAAMRRLVREHRGPERAP